MSELYHYGMKRRSGRYEWGSGENPYQHESWYWLQSYDKLREEGLSKKEIADHFGMSIRELNSKITITTEEHRAHMRSAIIGLKSKDWSNVAIANKLGITEGTVRNYLKEPEEKRLNAVSRTADILRDELEKNRYLDVGKGVEQYLGITRTRLDAALKMLQDEGYIVKTIKAKQALTPNYTYVKTISLPEVTSKELFENRDKIGIPLGVYSENNGESFRKIQPPAQLDSKRVMVRYAEEGGKDMDGVIELRRGVADISLGNSKYAQVRIGVDGTHYLKGMAIYADDLPAGIDVRFNTNKHVGTPMLGLPDNTVLKNIEADPENPFKATVKQKDYFDENGEKHLSPINIVREEGEWSTWSKRLSAQVLSKQYPALAKKQLDIEYGVKQDEFETAMSLTNPLIKKKMLESLSDDCDSSAVDLNAAALPRQGSYVILPLTEIKDTEIYAPRYKNGEQVCLIRYPHAGVFEIPTLTVNNSNKQGQKLITNDSPDAVGISAKVAERLSGADFDGDTVLVIPTSTAALRTSDALDALKDFDPHEQYKGYPGMKTITEYNKQMEMGKISNLITDMTIQGADASEIARAVKHSMVVIDARKHNLDYKQSFIDNGIAQLKEKYQGTAKSGASTLISRAGSELRVPERKAGAYITDPVTGKTKKYYTDPQTGEKLYTDTGRTIQKYVRNEAGKVVEVIDTGNLATITSTKMAEAKDAYSLSTGTKIENVYAKYANDLKALGNRCRLEASRVETQRADPVAKQKYASALESLKDKVALAESNAPLERKAQLIADQAIKLKVAENPILKEDKDAYTKVKINAIQNARNKVGAGRQSIVVDDDEWEAIQNHAVSTDLLERIISNADLDSLKQRAMPRESKGLSNAQLSRAQSLLDAGYTLSDVAEKLGVSTTTLTNNLK